MQALQTRVRELYYGSTPRAARARVLLVLVDLAIIVYFIATTFVPLYPWIIALDAVIGLLLAVELAARALAERDRTEFLTHPLTVVDAAIILSLLVPAAVGNFAFLRVIRAMRIMRSYQFTRQLKRRSRFFARNEEVVFSAINLLVFVFVVTAVVYVVQVETNESINNYVDALYFTVTALTTTGFGDIILVGSVGRLLAVLIMVVGVALFLRLLQTIFRPTKVRYECPDCGLTRHDIDAVHCKHCGNVLHIRTEGAS